MSIIAVPIQVDALVINESTDIVKLGADFAKLPYQDDQQIDRRTDIANLASSISYQSFNNQSSLSPGVHLHWALPDALTQGEVENDGLVMPVVPNRWLIIHRNSTGRALHRWVVESDYLYDPASDVPQRAVCVPWKLGDNDREQGTPPYRYLGRQLELSQWQREQSAPIQVADRYPDLNVLGWGNPYFSALYDECFSVFGCYDASTTSIQQVKNTHYEVIGWYSDSGEDYVEKHLQTELDKRREASDEAQQALEQAEQDYSQAQQAGATPEALADAEESVGIAERFKQEKIDEATLQRVVTDIADWKLDNVSDDTDTMLCFGRIAFASDATLDDGIDVAESELALAPSGSEALASYVSAKLADVDTTEMTDAERSAAEQERDEEQERIENQLLALSLSDTVRGENVDFINRLKTARHKQGFSQVKGGILWSFVGIQDIELAENMIASEADRQEAKKPA
jgi:hypothetical protein